MIELTRTRIGPFDLAEVSDLDNLAQGKISCLNPADLIQRLDY
jgi:hypothetical protein